MKNRYKVEACDLLQLIFSKFNEHQLHCGIEFDCHIDEGVLKKAVKESLKVLPLISCRFVEKWFRAYWEEDEFSVEDIVKIVKSKDAAVEAEKLMTFRIDEAKGPQLRISVIRDEMRDCLCIIINHMLCDGAGFKEYIYLLSSIYNHLIQNKSCQFHLEVGSRSIGQIFKDFSLIDKLRMFFQPSKLSKYDNGIKFEIEGNVNSPVIIKSKLSKDKFLAIKNYSKKYNATINDVMMAAYIRTLSDYLGCGGISIPCAIDLRKYLKNRKTQGICNLASNIICDIGTDIGSTYSETLLKVKKAMDKEKKNVSSLKGLLLLEIIFKGLPYKISKRIIMEQYKNPPIGITNIGLIDKSKLVFHGVNIENSYITGSIKYKPYFQVAITTFDDEVTLSVNLHCTERDREKIRKFLKDMEEELLEAVNK